MGVVGLWGRQRCLPHTNNHWYRWLLLVLPCSSTLQYSFHNKNNIWKLVYTWFSSRKILSAIAKKPQFSDWIFFFFPYFCSIKPMTQQKTPGKFSNTKITDMYSLWITLIYTISRRWLCLPACERLGSIFFFHLPQQTIPLSSDPVSFQSCNINCTLKISSLMLISQIRPLAWPPRQEQRLHFDANVSMRA